MKLFKEKLIPESEIPNLKNYSFKPGNYTYIDNVMLKYLWKPVCNHLPSWLSANILTLTGGFCVFLMNFLVFYYVPNFKSNYVPPWVSLVSAVLVFTYLTLDGLDGMQARKLGLASPLGQLLDHGTDAIVASFFCYFTFLMRPKGYSMVETLITVAALINTAAVNWQEETFGTFSYTNGFFIFGVSEPLLAAAGMLFINYLFPNFWGSNARSYLWKVKALRSAARYVPREMSMGEFMLYICLLIAFYTFIGFPYGMYKKHRSPKKFMHFSLYLLFNCVIPPFLMFYLPPNLHQLYAFFVSSLGGFGVVFIIFSNLRKTKRRIFYPEFAPHYALVLGSYALVLASKLLGINLHLRVFNCACFGATLWVVTVLGTVFGLTMYVRMLREIKEHLGLPFFTTRRPEKKAL